MHFLRQSTSGQDKLSGWLKRKDCPEQMVDRLFTQILRHFEHREPNKIHCFLTIKKSFPTAPKSRLNFFIAFMTGQRIPPSIKSHKSVVNLIDRATTDF